MQTEAVYRSVPLLKEQQYVLSCLRRTGRFTAGLALVEVAMPALTAQAKPLLTAAEYAQYTSLVSGAADQRASTWLAGRYAVKRAVLSCLPHLAPEAITIQKGVFDFPVLQLDAVQEAHTLSISHTSQLAVALCTREVHPMAVDIELVSDKTMAFGSDIYTAHDQELLAAFAERRPFGYTAFWTAKEAISKVLRTGLMSPFSLYEIASVTDLGHCLQLSYSHFPQYQCLVYRVGDHLLSLVLPARSSLSLHVDWS